MKCETFRAFSERRDAIEGADGWKLTADRFSRERRPTLLSARARFGAQALHKRRASSQRAAGEAGATKLRPHSQIKQVNSHA